MMHGDRDSTKIMHTGKMNKCMVIKKCMGKNTCCNILKFRGAYRVLRMFVVTYEVCLQCSVRFVGL